MFLTAWREGRLSSVSRGKLSFLCLPSVVSYFFCCRWDRFLQPTTGSTAATIKGPWKPDEERRLYLAAISCNAPTASKLSVLAIIFQCFRHLKSSYRFEDGPEAKKKFLGWKKVAEFVPAR